MTLDDLSLFAPTAPERITLPSARLEAAALPWQPHPAFPGVHMKHLVLGADTGGALSCHLVRVAAGEPGLLLLAQFCPALK
jgi:hypothetical protein